MKNFEDVRERVFKFALDVIEISSKMPRNQSNFVIIQQLLRSATSIGANLEEAAGAHTRVDFIYNMNISKKEARESNYWLRLLFQSNPASIQHLLRPLLNESEEILKILTSSVKNAQKSTLSSELKVQSS